MSRELVLHIGLPKCGSTYIQWVLLKNQAALAQVGIAYPHDGEGHPGNGHEFQNTGTSALDGLFGDRSRLIVSAETLLESGATAQPLARAVRELGVEVTILAILRPFSGWFFGDYSQRMKQFFDRYLTTRNPYDGEEFFDLAARRADKLKPADYIMDWQAAMPDAKVHLARHTDIRATLETYFNSAMIDWTVPLRNVNRSIRMQDCDLLSDMIRDRNISKDTIIRERLEAFKRAGTPDAGKTDARIARLEAMFETQNDALMERFGFDNRLPR